MENERINELALCESSRLGLRPNELYRFYVLPNCDTCKTEAKLTANGEVELLDDEIKRQDREDMELLITYVDPYRYGYWKAIWNIQLTKYLVLLYYL